LIGDISYATLCHQDILNEANRGRTKEAAENHGSLGYCEQARQLSYFNFIQQLLVNNFRVKVGRREIGWKKCGG